MTLVPSIEGRRPTVGLFVTCLVDLFRPSVGIAATKLLRDAGCSVEVPVAQACCGGSSQGQDAGEDLEANLKATITTFERCDFVVVPSGSCADMLKRQCASTFAEDAGWNRQATQFAGRVHELTSFLVDVLGVSRVGARMTGSVTYHDTCCGASAPRVQEQPRRLLRSVSGIHLKEPESAAGCCGLRTQGTAAAAMRIREAGAGTVTSDNLGCLMYMATQLRRDGSAIEVRHVAEVLAGMHETPPIGGVARQSARVAQDS